MKIRRIARHSNMFKRPSTFRGSPSHYFPPLLPHHSLHLEGHPHITFPHFCHIIFMFFVYICIRAGFFKRDVIVKTIALCRSKLLHL